MEDNAVTVAEGAGEVMDIDALIEAARSEGYDQGYEDGRADGYEDGVTDGYDEGYVAAEGVYGQYPDAEDYDPAEYDYSEDVDGE